MLCFFSHRRTVPFCWSFGLVYSLFSFPFPWCTNTSLDEAVLHRGKKVELDNVPRCREGIHWVIGTAQSLPRSCQVIVKKLPSHLTGANVSNCGIFHLTFLEASFKREVTQEMIKLLHLHTLDPGESVRIAFDLEVPVNSTFRFYFSFRLTPCIHQFISACFLCLNCPCLCATPCIVDRTSVYKEVTLDVIAVRVVCYKYTIWKTKYRWNI